MRTELDYLPEEKRGELKRVVKILFEEFEDALAGRTAPHRKAGRILKIILFGSYARGDWVDDPIGGYFSDYDILIVVNHQELTDTLEYWARAGDHLLREQTIAETIKTQVNFIVHSMVDVNSQLKHGRYFFSDIVRDGIVLFEEPNQPFTPAEKLAPNVAKAEARGFFDEWYPASLRASRTAQLQRDEGAEMQWRKEAVFSLHQSAERAYHCLLLVLTLYSPKSHKLNFLRSQAEQLDARLVEAWPRDTKFAQRCFELLRRAYVEARYSPHFKITDEELSWLGERVGALQALVETVCRERLET